ncbi:MAG TPA: hypothetical protein VLB68_28915 [Pyrinomonadaceae bacterium]|nr:hypothetical protein [Pyrinomonadaceae bacterium]
MGLQTDLFLGSVEDAQNYDGKTSLNVERIQLGGLTNLEFEILRAIVAGQPWEVNRHALEQIASTDESWTFRFPAAYVSTLQALDSEAMKRAANAWAATEEIAASASDVLPVIESLVLLAKSASATGLDLFVWTAL